MGKKIIKEKKWGKALKKKKNLDNVCLLKLFFLFNFSIIITSVKTVDYSLRFLVVSGSYPASASAPVEEQQPAWKQSEAPDLEHEQQAEAEEIEGQTET